MDDRITGDRIARWLQTNHSPTPFLVVDLDIILAHYRMLHRMLPDAEIFYAMKANPGRPILEMLAREGCSFDTASIFEIDQVLSAGAMPQRLSFGNTIKKQEHIAEAFEKGVTLYAFDSEGELDKLAKAAPGARVFCRIQMMATGADWPSSRKFGCNVDMARDLLLRARDLGLVPYGVSFHVGSQQRDLTQWDIALGQTAMLFTTLNHAGIELRMVNLGGGFPARYNTEIPAMEAYADAIMTAMRKHFGNHLPRMIIEPGRSMAGDAGVIQTEVVLISRKSYDDPRRWVYLDIGKFGGLAESMGECIQYRIRTPKDGGPVGPVVLAGPTCDEVDVMYDGAGYQLPLDLAVGDKLEILSAGAYTTTYSSVGFNGFPPLKEYFI
jgi:ornithine decarboxylase